MTNPVTLDLKDNSILIRSMECADLTFYFQRCNSSQSYCLDVIEHCLSLQSLAWAHLTFLQNVESKSR